MNLNLFDISRFLSEIYTSLCTYHFTRRDKLTILIIAHWLKIELRYPNHLYIRLP